MTSMTAASEPVILKTDRLGRVRTPVAQREALLDAFERSGLSGMKFAGWLLRQFQHLYQIEKALRQPNRHGKTACAKIRQVIRQAQAAPILQRMEKALHRFKNSPRHLPKSKFGQALTYALGQWDGLAWYLKDGRVELDNNLIENAIRPTGVGRKNYLFIGDAEAGETTAIFYTLIASARRRGLDPLAYLTDILRRRPVTHLDQIHTLTPAAWAQDRKNRQAA